MKYISLGLIAGLIAGFAAGLAVGRFFRPEDGRQAEKNHEAHGHVAHHGGSLNVIEKCEIAHLEVKVGDGSIECWFVGGGRDTGKSVRVPDEQVVLSVNLGDESAVSLALFPAPLELAGETVGDCSHFSGAADWLAENIEFTASGKATVKGTERKFIIRYPEGHDPEHGAHGGEERH